MNAAQLDLAAVLEMRAGGGDGRSLLVVGGPDQEVALDGIRSGRVFVTYWTPQMGKTGEVVITADVIREKEKPILEFADQNQKKKSA